VGCDALQVYRGLDAATGKPTASERERVPHHLIDCVDPRRDYSLADYVRDAGQAISAIGARGRVPVVVGGTGLYLRGLLKGVVEAPARDEALRGRLNALAARFGTPRLHRLLQRRDAPSAARILPGDTQRIVRALELALASGPSWSERLADEGTWSAEAERYDALKLGLDLDRDALAARLAARVDAFLAAGLADEVDRLLAGGLPEAANALKAIGYRETVRARREGRDPAGDRDAIVLATRRYAKRQRTWFRSERSVIWLDAARDSESVADEIAERWHRFMAPGSRGAAC